MHIIRKITLITLCLLLGMAGNAGLAMARNTQGNYLTVTVEVDGFGEMPQDVSFVVRNLDKETVAGILKVGADGRCYYGDKPYIDHLEPGRYSVSLMEPNRLYEFDRLTQEVILHDMTVLPETIEVGMIGHVFGVDSNGEWVGNDDGDTSTIIWDTTFGTTQFYCGNSDAKSPSAVGGIDNIGRQNTVTTEEMEKYEGADKEAVRKVMYYGWNGPAQWEGFTSGRYQLPYSSFEAIDITREQIKETGIHEERGLGQFITHVAINHYHNDGRDWWGNSSPTAAERQDGYSDFIAFLDTQPDPPESFVIYGWENYEEAWQPGNKRSTQDMFFSRSFLSGDYDHAEVRFTAIRKTGEFAIRKGIYSELRSAVSPFSPAGAVYRLFTDEKATVMAKDVDGNDAVLTVTDDYGLSNIVRLYLGQQYYLKEIRVPVGFVLDEEVYPIVLNHENEVLPVMDHLQKVRIVLQKKDSKSGTSELKDAVFGVYRKEGDEYIRVDEITTDEKGQGSSGELSPGIYYVKEVIPPKGYLVDTEYHEAKAYADDSGKAVIDCPVTVSDDPTEVEIIKTDGNGNPLSGAWFHVEDKEGNIIEAKWQSDGNPHVIRGLEEGVTYYLIEDEGVSGYFPLKHPQAFTVSGRMTTVKAVNEKTPSIQTKAVFTDSQQKLHLLRETVSVTDKVTLSDLTIGQQYLLLARLLDASDGSLIAETEKEFTADMISCDMTVVFDKVTPAETMVVTDELLRRNSAGEYESVCLHDDMNDSEQQVFIPSLSTSASSLANGSSMLANEGIQTIKDVVEYRSLLSGREYEMVTSLHYHNTGEPVMDADGNPYKVKNRFIPESSDGSTEILMDVDCGMLKGTRITVYEEVWLDGVLIASHCDPDDLDQTLSVPDLITQASHSEKDEDGYILKDSVQLQGFNQNDEVEITATVMDYESGRPLTDENGNTVASTVKVFGSEEETEIEIRVSAELIEDRKVVFFEEGRLNGSESIIVTHNDWENERQTVFIETVPETGDENRLAMYAGLLGLSLCGSSVILTYGSFHRRKRKK